MLQLRRLALSHRRLAAVLFALALLVKLALPAGTMPILSGKTLTFAMCSGTGPMTVTIPMEKDTGGKGQGQQNANDHPCAFSALGGPGLAAADPVVLAAALAFAFVFALFGRETILSRRTDHLRPPLRGPPALI